MPNSMADRSAELFAEATTLGLSDCAGVVVAGEATTAPKDEKSTASSQEL